MNKISISILASIILSNANTNDIFAQTLNGSKSDSKQLELCTSAEKLNLNPFRKINRSEFGYLSLVLMPIISEDLEKKAILEAWSFEKAGTVFAGRIRKDLTWSDGTSVKSTDVAQSIAMQLPFREIGKKIKTKASNNEINDTLQSRDTLGVEIVSDLEFKIRISTDIENGQGVFREALSAGARGNRIWPIKLNDSSSTASNFASQPVIVSNYPTKIKESEISIEFDREQWIAVTPKHNCRKIDFADSQTLISKKNSEYTTVASNSKQALIAFLPNKNELKDKLIRAEAIGWLRSIIPQKTDNAEIEIPRSHFMKNEPGGGKIVHWNNSSRVFPNKLPDPLKIFIFSKNTEKNIFGKSIEDSAKKAKKRVIWISDGKKIEDAHIALSPTRISDGRQTWFQDIFTNKFLREFIGGHKKTTEALLAIMKKSSATIPTDNITLQNLEEGVFEEQSIAPLARFGLKLFSRNSSPYVLAWTETDEWTILRRGKL